MNIKYLIIFISLLFATACGSKKELTALSPNMKQELVTDYMFRIKEYAKDKQYGYTEAKPIKVGGVTIGPSNERRFLNALAGPQGEKITYKRLGSCCHFKTKNSPFNGVGLLDKYSITYDGLEEGIVLYLNMYDSDTLKVPVGFTLVYEYDAKME